MVHINVLAVVTVAVLVAITGVVANSGPSGRIVNGNAARNGTFMYQVAVFNGTTNRFLCSGSLVSGSHVVTVAHCVYNSIAKPKQLNVSIGALDLRKPNWYVVKKVTVHSNFNVKTNSSDIAILQLKESVKSTPQYPSVVAKLATKVPSIKASCYVSGWGKNTPTGARKDTLMYNNVTILSIDVCKKELQDANPILTKTLCGKRNQGSGTVCDGDDGDPLVCGNVLSGLVSTGIRCVENKPVIFTDISNFTTWINTQVKGGGGGGGNTGGAASNTALTKLLIGALALLVSANF